MRLKCIHQDCFQAYAARPGGTSSSTLVSWAHRDELTAAGVISDVLDSVDPTPTVKLDVVYSEDISLQSQGMRLSWADTAQAPSVPVSHPTH